MDRLLKKFKQKFSKLTKLNAPNKKKLPKPPNLKKQKNVCST